MINSRATICHFIWSICAGLAKPPSHWLQFCITWKDMKVVSIKCITILLMLIHFYHPIYPHVFVESQALSGRTAQFLITSSYLLRVNNTLIDGNRGVGGGLLYPTRIIRTNLDTSVSLYLPTFIWQIPGISRQPPAHQPISLHHRSQSCVAAMRDHASNPGIMLGCKNRLLA